jgi:hypothetical protein
LGRYAFPVAAWAIWRVSHLAMLAVVGGYPRSEDGFELKYAWDARYYRGILAVGYEPVEVLGHVERTNFFPLVSWLTWLVKQVVRSEDAAITIVVTASSLAAVVLVHAAARRWTSDGAARVAVVLLLLFPVSLVLWWFYAEALFIALSAGALLAYDRGRLPLATVLGVGVALTRPFGFAIGLALAAALYAARRLDVRSLAWCAVPLLGLATVCVVQWVQVDDPVAFLDSGRAHAESTWGGEEVYPFKSFVQGTRMLVLGWPFERNGLPLDYVAEWGFLILAVAVATSTLPMTAKVWTGVTVATPLVAGLLFSGARYMLAAWPVFVFLGERLERRRLLLTIVLVAFAALTVERYLVWHDADFIG